MGSEMCIRDRISEGGHLAHISLFGHPIVPMAKSTFYFVIGILVLTDIVQSRYQRKLMRMKKATHGDKATKAVVIDPVPAPVINKTDAV